MQASVASLFLKAWYETMHAGNRCVTSHTKCIPKWRSNRYAPLSPQRNNVGASVIIVVATPHRGEAFDACRYIIDTLKTTVPIWKKEVATNGEEWVEG